MKIVLGLIPHDGGTVEVLGARPGSGAARAGVAYLPESAAFHPALTGRETIAHYLRLRGQPAAQAGALLDRVGLSDAADRRIGTYSKGMRQRVGLAQALIGHPRLMVLDEPTSGLDPVSRRGFYTILEELAAEGAAILLSSHALTEVEARTDRMVILARGRLMAEGSLNALRRAADLPVTVELTAVNGARAAILDAVPGGELRGDRITYRCRQDQKMDLLRRLSAQTESLEDIEMHPPSLEDLYTHFSREAAQ
jgi:Cu-processing system ATP-binding protein